MKFRNEEFDGIKVIVDMGFDRFEKTLENFCSNKTIIDLQFAVENCSPSTFYYALVLWRKKKDES